MLWRPENVDDLMAWKDQFLKQAISYAGEFSLRAPPSTTWAGCHNEKAKNLILKLNKHPHRFEIEIAKAEYQQLLDDMNGTKLTAEYVSQMSTQILQERKDRKTKRGRKHLYLNLQMELLSVLLHLRSANPLPEKISLDILKRLLWGDDSELAQSLSAIRVNDLWWPGRVSADVFDSLKRIDLELRDAIVSRILNNAVNVHYRAYAESHVEAAEKKTAINRSQFFKLALNTTHSFQKSLNENLLVCARKRPLKCNPNEALRAQEHQASCVAKKVNFCGMNCDFYKVVYMASEACAKIGYEPKITRSN